MWTYKSQIKIRWFFFIAGLIILVSLISYLNFDNSLSKTGMKVILTRIQIDFESLPVWSYLLLIVGSILTLMSGMPSVCVILPLMLLKGCTFAYIVGVACQIVSSFLAMWLSYKITPPEISNKLKENLDANQKEFQKFAFWSRIYYNIPLRTIDQLTPFVHNSKESLFSSLIAAASAILIRICIPTLILKRIIEQFTLLAPNPSLEYNKLLLWAIILIIYTLIPKMPEIMVCPSKIKEVILELESPAPSSSDKEIDPKTTDSGSVEISSETNNNQENSQAK